MGFLWCFLFFNYGSKSEVGRCLCFFVVVMFFLFYFIFSDVGVSHGLYTIAGGYREETELNFPPVLTENVLF